MSLGKTALDNGFTVVSEQVPYLRSVTAGIWVVAGSRAETPADNGISHFIEHMLFKGTSRRRAADISREIEAVGGMMNAFTDREYTFLFAKALDRDFPLVVDLLCDTLLDSRFDGEEMEREKGVVMQEILMAEDTPEDFVHDFFHASYWGGHPLGFPVQGTSENVASFSRGQLLEYFGEQFMRGGAVVSVVGNQPHDRVVEAFARPLASARLKERPRHDAPPRVERGTFLSAKPIEQLHLVLGAPGVSRTGPLRHAAHILNGILGGSASSRLFQEVREKRGLAYSIGSSLSSYSDSGILKIAVGTTADKGTEVLAVIADVLGEVREGRFGDDEVALAREQIKGGMLLSLESAEYRMSRLGLSEMFLGRLESPEEELRQLDGVTPDGVRALASGMLRRELFSLAAVGELPAGPGLSL